MSGRDKNINDDLPQIRDILYIMNIFKSHYYTQEVFGCTFSVVLCSNN